MSHLLLFSLCILSIEVFIRSNFLLKLKSIINVSKKAIYVLKNKNITDHWKEKVIPAYSVALMKEVIYVLLILLLIFTFFIGADNFFENFIESIFSLIGFMESIAYAFGYIYLRKFFKNE